MTRTGSVAVAVATLLVLAGCTPSEPPGGVLPPLPSVTVTSSPTSPATQTPSTPSSTAPTVDLPRGWPDELGSQSAFESPKTVASAFVQAMFLADNRTDEGNGQPFARAAAVFGTGNAAAAVEESAQPPAGNEWAAMRKHNGYTTVKVEVDADSDAGDDNAFYGTAEVMFTDGKGWHSAGPTHDVLVQVTRADDGTWRVDDFRFYR